MGATFEIQHASFVLASPKTGALVTCLKLIYHVLGLYIITTFTKPGTEQFTGSETCWICGSDKSSSMGT